MTSKKVKVKVNVDLGSGLFILFIVFLVLKLCKVVAWSWWLVTSPLWAVPGGFLLILGVIFMVIYLKVMIKGAFGKE